MDFFYLGMMIEDLKWKEREISRINVLIYRLRVPAKKIYRLRGKTKAFDIILIKKI